MTKFIYIFFIISLIACANLEQRNRERAIQSRILDKISEQNHAYASCAKKHKIFDQLKKDRIRIDMSLTLNHEGKINKFEILNQSLPETFIDCMFKVTDLIIFPSLEDDEVIELSQPFIFNR